MREKYGPEEGDEVSYIDLGDRIILLPKPRDLNEALKKINVDTDRNIKDIKKEALETAIQ